MQHKKFSWNMAGRMAGLLLVAGLLGTAHAQYGGFFTGNKRDKPIDVSSYPANIQQGYKAFKYTCSECHTLDRALRTTQTPATAEHWVHVMQAKPAADFDDRQAEQIIDFINYYQSHLPKDKW
ncbi:MAG: c-type cytochrome [Acidobacteriaceae bacterium]